MQDVLDLRVGRKPRSSSASSSSDDTVSERDGATSGSALLRDEEQLSPYCGEGYSGNGGKDENDPNTSNAEENSTVQLQVQDALDASASSTADRKMRQRFGPEEDYLLTVQVNVDAPFMAEHGEVNKKWQGLAHKLNSSPNFNMKAIKGTTAKVRFKTLLAKHRAWESESAKKSGMDESETPFIRVMTELVSSVDDYEAKLANKTATKKGEQLAKEHSGEVVRQAAVARIQLGKRLSRGDVPGTDINEVGEAAGKQNRPNRSKGEPEWMALLEESKMQRASMFQDFMKQQQNEQKQRHDFERVERAKDRAERTEERKERQQERDVQAKLIASLLERISKG